MTTTAVVIEQCRVSPPKDDDDAADNEISLPMTFFDMLWYTFPVSQVVLFFEVPNCSRSHFLETIVPSLKHSLSLTIKHLLPLSGHIVHPLDPVGDRWPVLRYRPGDSISFTVAESKRADDYIRLIGKQPRASDDFYSLVAELPPETERDDSVMVPVIALQVTLFQGLGISIGSVTHHAAGDAVTTEMFYKAWAWMTRSLDYSNGDDGEARRKERVGSCTLPCYDRATVADINGLDSFYWDRLKCCRPVPGPHVALPTNKWRATFVLTSEQVKKLKSYVMARCPDLTTTRLSTFAVTVGLAWTCSSRAEAESVNAEEEEEEEDEEAGQVEVLGFVIDCRERLNPKLPRNYFGNCLAFAKAAELTHGDVVGVNGFVLAVEAIAKAVRDKVYSTEKGILNNARHWDDEFGKDLQGKKLYGVAGFPRFDIYNVDFGWGNPKRFEPLFIDNDRSILLCKSVEFEGGIEIGISKTKSQMDAFVRLFHGALQEFTSLSNL